MKDIFNKIIILTFIFILLLGSSCVFASYTDIKFRDVSTDVLDYLASISSEFNDKTNYKFLVHRYGGHWSAVGINVNNIPDNFLLYFISDRNGDFNIAQTSTDNISVIRYDFKYDLSSFNRRVYDEPFGRDNPSSSGYWIDSDDNLDNGYNYLYSDFDIYTNIKCSEIMFNKTEHVLNPYIVNSVENLSSGTFDYVRVDLGDYDITNNKLYLHLCKQTEDVSETSLYYYEDYVYCLEFNGKYYENYYDGLVYYFSLPLNDLPFSFDNGETYIFYLSSTPSNLGGAYNSSKPISNSEIFDSKFFTVGGLTDEQKEKAYQDKISSTLDKQKDAIDENTKTSKSILSKIGDILSYINPFSDNFFGKKLVDLILDGLKSLFVPADDFFSNYFSELKDWFSDRLGFLWTPFDLIIDILNKMLNINFSEPVFYIPDIKESFTNTQLVSKQEYNLNSLLDNEVFKNVHDIYFLCVDAVVIFALVNLAKFKIEEVFKN